MPAREHESFEVVLKSTAPTGRFTRKEVESICASDNTSMSTVIRSIRKAIVAWDPQVKDEIMAIRT
eukprot:589930-Hanusia_phi.AAC.1